MGESTDSPAEGVTQADLQEQFGHNMRMRAMIGEASQLVSRVRDAQGKLRGAAGSEAEKAKALEAIASRLLTEPVRYGKPGLQAHILYLAGMTGGVDQEIGRDAVERYQVLRRELDSLRADLERTLGPGN